MENFLKSSNKINEFKPNDSQNSFKIGSILLEIKNDFPEIFDKRETRNSNENLHLLNTLIDQTRQLDPQKDWTNDLPFYISKIKNQDSVF